MLKKIIFFTLLIGFFVGEEIGVYREFSKESPNFIYLPAPRFENLSQRGFGSFSFLFWQAKIWGLEFAGKSFLPNPPGTLNQNYDEKFFVPDFAWKPGFRGSLGCYLPIDHWDLTGSYTYYQEVFTSLKKRFEAEIVPEGLGVIPLWFYPFLQISGLNTSDPLRFQKAKSNWKMNFNSFDLDLGRSFLPNTFIPMKLKLGLKGAYIDQFYHVDYENGTTVQAVDMESQLSAFFRFDSSHFQVKTDQWSLGPKLGFQSNWNTWKGLSLIGNGAFSILYSFFKLNSKYSDLIFPNPGLAKLSMKENFHELTPVIEAMLGIEWKKEISRTILELGIGFEWQYWYSINHARRNYVQSSPGTTYDSQGDLQMQGLNASMKLVF